MRRALMIVLLAFPLLGYAQEEGSITISLAERQAIITQMTDLLRQIDRLTDERNHYKEKSGCV